MTPQSPKKLYDLFVDGELANSFTARRAAEKVFDELVSEDPAYAERAIIMISDAKTPGRYSGEIAHDRVAAA